MEVPLDDFEYLTQDDDDVMVREEVADYFKAIPQSVNIYVAHTDDLSWAHRLPNEIQGKVSGFKSRGQVTLTDISNIGKLYPQIQKAMKPDGINLLYVYPKSFEVPAGGDTFIADVNPHYLAHDLHHMIENAPGRERGEKDKFTSLIKEYLMELVWLSHGGGSMEAEQVRDSMKHTGRRLGVSNPDILLSDLFPGVKLPSGDFDLFGDIFADYLKNDGNLVLGVPEQLSMKNGDIIELNPDSKHDQRAQQYEKKFKDLFDTVLDPLKGKVAMFNIFEVEHREVERARKQAEEKMQVDHGALIDHIKAMGGEFKYFDESYKEEGVEELIFDTGLKPEKPVMKVDDFVQQFPKEAEGIESLGYKITSAFDGFGQSPVEIRLKKASIRETILRQYIRNLLLEKSLTGRKLEKVAETITNEVIEYLFDPDLRNAYATQGQLKFNVDIKLPKNVVWLRNVSVELIPHDDFNSSAAYQFDLDADDEQRKTSDILLQLYMPTDYEDEEIHRFKIEIESDIRHELEHSGQSTDVLMDVQKKVPDSEIWKTLQRAEDYYTSEAEVPSYVAGLVIKSKRKGEPAADVIDKELYNIYATGLDSGYSKADLDPLMKKIREIWQYYLMTRWPEQDWPIELRDILESITLDLEHGDIILTGKFKNKRTIVKKIGKDEYGHPTINGKSILRFKVEKLLPRDRWSKKSKEEFEEK